jgi:hypothetical protein
MRTIFANLIISKAEPIIVSLMTGGQHHKNKIFVNCIKELVSQGSITLHKGEFHKDRSTIIPSPSLQAKILRESSPADIICPNRAITLSATEKKDGKRHITRLPIPSDDENILRMASQIEEINSFIAEAAISFNSPLSLIDLSKRRLYRVFKRTKSQGSAEDFQSYGRIYGGFWESMKKEERAWLRINGESLNTLDFSSTNLHLAYSISGQTPPSGDLYSIPGIPDSYRPDVKTFISARWFSKRKAFPSGSRLKEIGSFSEVLTLVHERHPSLKEILSQENIGFRLANLESEILVQILLRLKDKGIVALPIHDAILVRTSDTESARTIMATVSREFIGFSIPVSTSRIEIEISGEDGDSQRVATLSFFSEDILQRTKEILIVDVDKLLEDSVPSPPPVPQEASARPASGRPQTGTQRRFSIRCSWPRRSVF